MKLRSPRRILLATAVEAAAVLLLHLLLLHLVARQGTASTLLASGAHAGVLDLLLAAAFLALRLVALLVLPGFVAYRLVLLALSWHRWRRSG